MHQIIFEVRNTLYLIVCPKILTIGLILATRETKMFAHLTVPKQLMFDQTFVLQTKTLRLFGA